MHTVKYIFIVWTVDWGSWKYLLCLHQEHFEHLNPENHLLKNRIHFGMVYFFQNYE